MRISPTLALLESPRWQDYALVDSGAGTKLERFGQQLLVRPEAQAVWHPSLEPSAWAKADAVFTSTGEESGGHWDIRRKMPDRWQMSYPLPVDTSAAGTAKHLKFWAMTTPGRHLGVFPEAGAQWDFLASSLHGTPQPLSVLNLFGYTGLATLAAAAVGARVTHVDASRKSVNWARENQSLSGLEDRPIRWIVDDAVKFTAREVRRGAQYDGIIVDPPKFGRGPKGEVWEVYRSLPQLMALCRQLLSPRPRFVIVTMYAVRASGIHLAQLLGEVAEGHGGDIECGELVTREQSGGRLLSQAVFARWQGDQ
jgi:23S rRNA (cytosine1962-C5)-methyltransferase